MKSFSRQIDDILTIGAMNQIEKIHASQEKRLNVGAEYTLTITQKKTLGSKRSFVAMHDNGEEKYFLKNDFLCFGHPCIRLYDSQKRQIGYVENKAIKSTKSIYKQFDVYLDNERLGTLTEHHGILLNMDFDLNGWHIVGNVLQSIFDVYDRHKQLVLQIDKTKSDSFKDIYILRYDNRHNEIIGILLAMAIDLTKNDK